WYDTIVEMSSTYCLADNELRAELTHTFEVSQGRCGGHQQRRYFTCRHGSRSIPREDMVVERGNHHVGREGGHALQDLRLELVAIARLEESADPRFLPSLVAGGAQSSHVLPHRIDHPLGRNDGRVDRDDRRRQIRTTPGELE